MKRWYQVYSTLEELRMLIGVDKQSGLVRSQNDYRSVASLAKEAHLSEAEVRIIIANYLAMGLVVLSKSKQDHYAYWERVVPGSLSSPDQS